MTPRPLMLLLLLAAVMLSCCISPLQAAPRSCLCLRTSAAPIRPQIIRKVEVIPVSGRCRRTEVIVTRKNGSRVCVPPMAQWVTGLLERLQRETDSSGWTTDSPPV